MDYDNEFGYQIQPLPDMLKCGEGKQVPNLGLDEALLRIDNSLKVPVDICWRSEECFGCPDISQGLLDGGHSRAVVLSSRYPNQIFIKSIPNNETHTYCEKTLTLFDHGVYSLKINNQDGCLFSTEDPGKYELIPLAIMMGTYLGMTLLLMIVAYLWKVYKNSGINDLHGRFNRLSSTSAGMIESTSFRNIPPDMNYRGKNNRNLADDSDAENVLYSRERLEFENAFYANVQGTGLNVPPLPPRNNDCDEEEEERKRSTAMSIERAENELKKTQERKKNRIRSLDAFRGVIIMFMIFVNSGGGGYTFFEHSSWYAMTSADIIFPAFILIMGFSIALSIRSRLMMKKDFALIGWKIMRRTSKLFLLGVMLNTDHSSLRQLRIMGVLQRFSISYFFVATFHLVSVYRGNKFLTRTDPPKIYQVLFVFLPEIFAHIGVLVIYLYFTFWFNYDPSCPRGYQGPGGLEQGGRFFNCTGGAANYIDRLVMGEKHMYQKPTSQGVYKHTLPHDPEGLLGLTTSILLTEFGLVCGRTMIRAKSHYTRLLRWLLLSCVAGFLALCLVLLGSKDLSPKGIIPIVKNLWSLSYVSASASISLICFIIFYVLIDATKVWKNGFPFHFAGSNAILLYIGHQIMGRYFPFFYGVDDSSHGWLLFRCSVTTTIWLIIATYLHKKKFFLTV